MKIFKLVGELFNKSANFCSGLGSCVTASVETFFDYIKNNYHKILQRIAVLWLCINPFLSVLACHFYSIKEGLVLSVLILVLSMAVCVMEASIKYNEVHHRKRLTHMNEYGDIEIDESDLHEALRLLYEIENEIGVR